MVCQWQRDFAQCGVSGAEELGQNEDYWGGKYIYPHTKHGAN